MPPEVLGFSNATEEDRRFQYATDMWALGETIFRMLTKRVTFPNIGRLAKYAMGTVSFPAAALSEFHVSTAGVNFISSLMITAPGSRLTAKDALEHEWIS